MGNSGKSSTLNGLHVNEIAGSATHALNNALGILGAATEWLMPSADPTLVGKARAAIGDVEARIQAVSDALQVLATEPGDLMPGARSGRAYQWDPFLSRRIEGALARVAGVALCAPSERAGVTALPFDCETVRCLLVCMAVSLRRRTGVSASLHCVIDHSPADRRWTFAVLADPQLPVTVAECRPSDHPCEQALDYAGGVLRQHGGLVEMDRHSVRLQPWVPGAAG